MVDDPDVVFVINGGGAARPDLERRAAGMANVVFVDMQPKARLPEVLAAVCAIADRHGLRLSNVFHAGDGNLHPNISFDRRDAGELERVLTAGREILETCVAAGGAISGEHGIGVEKREYMKLVYSDEDLEAMCRLRGAFDPDGVCNPGKVFPTTRFCIEANPKARGYDRVPL